MTLSDAQRDVIDLLTEDHHEVLDLLEQIKSSTDDAERRDLCDTVISELVRHSVAEEMYVYPAMREHLTDGDEAVQHDTTEHQELEKIMKRLEGLEPDNTLFTVVLRELESVLRDHIDDEEKEQFPQLRAAIPRAELIELGENVERAKRLAPTRPHPAAPNNELFHKLVGPGIGMVDRLRDRLSHRGG